MPALTTTIDTRSDSFRANQASMQALVEDLRSKAESIRKGGSESARQKHLGRGKLLPRERVDTLIDQGSPFLEVGQLAAYGMYGENIASAGIITGIGRV